MAKKKAKLSLAKARAAVKSELKRNIDEGVRFLDIVVGRKEWLKRMNMKLFKIVNANTCVVGNVFANGLSGYEHFCEAMRHLQVEDRDGVRFGFHDDPELYRKHGSVDQYQMLQDMWVAKIKSLKRRKAA